MMERKNRLNNEGRRFTVVAKDKREIVIARCDTKENATRIMRTHWSNVIMGQEVEVRDRENPEPSSFSTKTAHNL